MRPLFDRDLRTPSDEGGGEIAPVQDLEGVSPLPSSPPRKGMAAALNPSAKPIGSKGAKRRHVVRRAGGTAEARERFARTFADVMSGRFGGRWTVEWEGPDASPLGSNRALRPTPTRKK